MNKGASVHHKEPISGGKEMLQCQGFACPGSILVFLQPRDFSVTFCLQCWSDSRQHERQKISKTTVKPGKVEKGALRGWVCFRVDCQF